MKIQHVTIDAYRFGVYDFQSEQPKSHTATAFDINSEYPYLAEALIDPEGARCVVVESRDNGNVLIVALDDIESPDDNVIYAFQMIEIESKNLVKIEKFDDEPA